MKRVLLDLALLVIAMVLGLEAVHYRQAVLEANIDRNRAWKTVAQLRQSCGEHAQGQSPR